MKSLKRHQRDILLIGLLIALQIVFTVFFPIRSHDTSFNQAEITRQFLWLNIEIPHYSMSTFYFPFLGVIYTAILAFLLIEKDKHLALIYGMALVLFAQLSFVYQLYNLTGTYTNIYSTGIWINSINHANAQLAYATEIETLAQDITLVVLTGLLAVKLAFYGYVLYYNHKKRQA